MLCHAQPPERFPRHLPNADMDRKTLILRWHIGFNYSGVVCNHCFSDREKSGPVALMV
jgi:hypothetical protein